MTVSALPTVIFMCVIACLYFVSMDRQVRLQRGTRTCFGVSVDPAFHETAEAARIYRRWKLFLWMQCILLFAFNCAAEFLSARFPVVPLSPISFWVVVICGFISYRSASRAVRPYAAEGDLQRTAILLSAPKMTLRWKWILGTVYVYAVLFVAGCWLMMYRHSNLLRYRLAQQAQGAHLPGAEAAVQSLLRQARIHEAIANYFKLYMCVFMLFFLLWTAFGLWYRSRAADWMDSTTVDMDYRCRVMLMMAMMPFLFVQLLLRHELDRIAEHNPGSWPGWLTVITILPATLLLLCTLTMFWLYYNKPKGLADRIPNARWKWGQFYVDRDDPAWFVPARTGAGAAMNYGNRAVQGMTACYLLLLVTFVVLLQTPLSHPESNVWEESDCKCAPIPADRALYKLARDNMHYGDHKDAAVVLAAYAQAHPESATEVTQALHPPR